MNAMPEIICLGEAMVEFVRRDNADGTPLYAQGYGGDTSNTAIAAARQGCPTGYISAVGTDPFGDALMDLWQREAVDTAHVSQNADAPTGIYFVDPDPSGRQFTYYRAGSAASVMTPADLDEEFIARARILHVSGISLAISASARDMVIGAISMARTHGVKVSVDTNLRLKLWPLDEARKYIHQAIKGADIALPSYDDAVVLTGLEDKDAIIDFYRELGAGIVALKLGDEGCRLAWGDQRIDIAPFAVKAVDSTGAGDTFAGAFLAHLLKTDDPPSAARYACGAAALAVSGYGAVKPIPDQNAVLDLIGQAPGEKNVVE
jgi:2-dehydro-3-deoxygluconokinase